MTTKHSFWVLWAAIFACSTFAWASEFVNPPEENWDAWQTVFPYQRNILWDFATDPREFPPDYEGEYDDKLKTSDFVEFTGDMKWFASVPGVGNNPYDGVIGIDNRSGNVTAIGSAIFHIDNFIREWPLKNVWLETVDGASGSGTLSRPLTAPSGFTVLTQVVDYEYDISEDPLLNRYNIGWTIEPNPPWEELALEIEIAAGGYWFIDSVHLATECVPEPASLLLLGLGGLALMKKRRV